MWFFYSFALQLCLGHIIFKATFLCCAIFLCLTIFDLMRICLCVVYLDREVYLATWMGWDGTGLLCFVFCVVVHFVYLCVLSQGSLW